MKFDILEAISTIKEHFGTTGEITVSSLGCDVTAVTLNTVYRGKTLRSRFGISPDATKLTIDIGFKHAIRELQLAIQQYDENPEETHVL